MASMELDLLSHRFQIDPPFGSMCETHGRVRIEIIYPDEVEYGSEGRLVTLTCPDTVKEADLVISSTRFLRSGLRVWHAVISPADGGHLNEYEVIKLIHLYDGRSERTALANMIRFRLGGEQDRMFDAAGLLRAVCPAAGSVELHAGTIEILTDKERAGSLRHADLLQAVRAASTAPNEAERRRIDKWIDDGKAEGRAICAYSGILTGILDFSHLDVDEALDSLTPTLPDSSALVRLNRSTLSYISEDDRIMRECWSSVGISPYLIIPHAALIHNDALTDIADTAIERVLSSTNGQLAVMEETFAAADRNLNGLYLPNVFNYDSERALFEQGAATSGSADKYSATAAKLRELGGLITAQWEARRDRGQMAIAALLAMFSVFQAKDVVFSIAGPGLGPGLRWILLAGLAAILLLLITHFWGMGSRRARK